MAVATTSRRTERPIVEDGFTRLVRTASPNNSGACLEKTASGKNRGQSAIRLANERDILSRHRLNCALTLCESRGQGGELRLIYADCSGVPLPELGERSWLAWLEVFAAMVGCVDELHQCGLLHLNLRPEYFLVGDNDVHLVDFTHCLRRSRAYPELEKPDLERQDLCFIAPELTGRANRPVDYRSDYYSLGASLYACLCGHPPFSHHDPLELMYQHLAVAPYSLREINSAIPKPLEQIVLRLLEKDPDRRYQSAGEILEHIELARGALDGSLKANPEQWIRPRTHSRPMHIAHRLYGRERQIKQLLASFDRACQRLPQLVLIEGPSGIGKSALIGETYLPLTRRRALYLTGKFDPVREHRPYSAWLSGLEQALDRLLAEPPKSLSHWRRRISAALGAHAGMLCAQLPALTLILGPQKPPPTLPPAEARELFHQLFLQLIGVFCEGEQPLIIFLDDLQWIDNSSLELLEVLLQRLSAVPLLLIGTYRNDELGPNHPLKLTLESTSALTQFALTTISLDPLNVQELAELAGEITQRDSGAVTRLAQELERKSGGNPFYVWQLLHHWQSNGVLAPDANGRWRWDLVAIGNSHCTDNIVSVMLDRFESLPDATRQLLAWAACLGTQFDLITLSWLAERSPGSVYRDLEVALSEEFILPRSRAQLLDEQLVVTRFAFFHDRMQEAAYRSLSPDDIAPLHYRIAHLYLENLSAGEREQRLIEVVNHLNHATGLISDQDECLQLARLNFQSARQAKDSAAFEAALKHLRVGMEKLPENIWQLDSQLAFDLFRERAELEYLNSHFDRAEQFCHRAIEQETNVHRRAELHLMLITQYTLRSQYNQAIATGRQALAYLNEPLPSENLCDERDRQLNTVFRWRKSHSLEALAELPPMTDKQALSIMKLLTALGPPCYRAFPQLWSVIVPRQVSLCLRYGIAPGITYSFPALGGLLMHISRIDGANCQALADVTQQLMHRDCADDSVGHLMVGSSLRHWFAPLSESTQDYLNAYKTGQASGNLQYAVYGFGHNTYCRFFRGEPLSDLIHDSANYLSYARQRGNLWGIDLITGALRIFAELHGNGPGCDWLDEPESQYLARCERHDNLQVLCIYYLLRAVSSLLNADLVRAHESIVEAEKRLDSVSVQGLLPSAQFHGIKALIRYRQGSATIDDLRAVVARYRGWAKHAPLNFEHWQHLTQSLVYAQQGNTDACVDAFKRAQQSADAHGGWLASALVQSTAEHYWHNRSQPGYAYWHGRQWCQTLNRGEVHGLQREQGNLPNLEPSMAATLQVARTLSQCHTREQLSSQTLYHLRQLTGAQRLALLLSRNGELELVAEHRAKTQRYYPSSRPLGQCQNLPQSIIRYVARTQKSLQFSDNDIDRNLLLSNDEYLARCRQTHPHAVHTCLPMAYLGEPLGAIYVQTHESLIHLEAEQLALLEFLATQAAAAICHIELNDAFSQEKRHRREAELKISTADTEVTMHREKESTLKKLASTDELTQLANRRLFMEQLHSRWEMHRDSSMTSCPLLMIDIDFFKEVNDRYGHAAGDYVLQSLAQQFQEQLRPGDLCARLGGEEFAVLLHDTSLEVAAGVAERLRVQVEQSSCQVQGQSINYTISIGLTQMRASDASYDDSLSRADRALYQAKHDGRNRVRQV